MVDPYCIPGTNILRNLLGILDRGELSVAESDFAATAGKILYHQPSSTTDLKYLRFIHRQLFGQVYPWAGETRRALGRMSKTRENGSVVLYGPSDYVDSELTRMFALLAGEHYPKGLPLDVFAQRAGYFYGELDAIHAFREGNSRTLSAFFYAVAHNAGYRFDWNVYAATEESRDRLYRARDRAVMHGDSSLLAGLFHSILSPL